MSKGKHTTPMGGREYTLEEIGKQLGVTRERVRQIEAKAIRKLQHRCRMNGYRYEDLFPNLDR